MAILRYSWKIKIQTSEPLNLLKWQILRPYFCQFWFHVKSEWQENSVIFTLCLILSFMNLKTPVTSFYAIIITLLNDNATSFDNPFLLVDLPCWPLPAFLMHDTRFLILICLYNFHILTYHPLKLLLKNYLKIQSFMPVKLATLMVVDLYWNVAIIKVHKLYRDTQQQVQTHSLRQRFQCSQLWNFVKAKKNPIKYVNMHFVMAKKLLKNGYFSAFLLATKSDMSWKHCQTSSAIFSLPPPSPFFL